IARHIGEHGFVPAKDAARFRAAPDANSTSTDDFDYCVPDPGDTDVLDVFEDRLVGDVAIAVAVGGPGITAVAIGRLGVTVPGGTVAVSPYFAHLRRRRAEDVAQLSLARLELDNTVEDVRHKAGPHVGRQLAATESSPVDEAWKVAIPVH